jgi:hypothetical protein
MIRLIALDLDQTLLGCETADRLYFQFGLGLHA